MLVSLQTILGLADATNTAVAAFNVTSMDSVRTIIDAAEELNKPVIIQFAAFAHEVYIPFTKIGPVMIALADAASVPVCVHLDHGANLTEVKTALDMGFTGVMIDGSALPYEQNVAITRAAVEIAMGYGASVEAEIGHMGSEGDSVEVSEDDYTKPDMAAQFVTDTNIDALACSFGTVHGLYKATPKLDIPRIKDIYNAVNLPLVMHGGSGISDADFKKCIHNGIRKINFYTYAVKYAGEAVIESLKNANGTAYSHDIVMTIRESMLKTYKDTINVFSNP